MFSVESDHAERGRTLRLRGGQLAGVAAGLWQLSKGDLVEPPFWLLLTMVAVSVVLGASGQLLIHRSKQFEALDQADQVFRTASAVPSVVGDAPAVRRSLPREPERDPVVYLRPFGEDNEGAGLLSWILDDFSGGGGSLEEQLSSVAEAIGPMVAIGQPGEPLPTLGAVRVYTHEDEWRTVVLSWMARARLVILRPGSTPGVAWEIEAALSRVPADRLLVLIVRMRRDRFEAIRTIFLEHQVTLPRFDDIASLGRASALFAFDPRYRPQRVPLAAPFWRGPDFALWQKRFHYALRPYFDRHDLVWMEPPLRIGLIASLIAAAAFVLVLGLTDEDKPPIVLERPAFVVGPDR